MIQSVYQDIYATPLTDKKLVRWLCWLPGLLFILVACSQGDTTELDEQQAAAAEATAAKEQSINFEKSEPAGDTYSETITVGSPQGTYESVTTILIVPNTLSQATHTQDREAFHQALRATKIP